MAGLARGDRGRDMVAWFSQACAASDVAARTACSNAGVVHRRATLERGGGAMAGLAGRCSRDVGAWFA